MTVEYIHLPDLENKVNQLSKKMPENVYSGYNKPFGNSVDTIAEGSHTHYDILNEILKIKTSLGIETELPYEDLEWLTDVTPSKTEWVREGAKDTIVEDGLIAFTTYNDNGGFSMNKLEWVNSTLLISANILTPNSRIIIKMHDGSKWSFHYFNYGDCEIAKFVIPAGLSRLKIAIEGKGIDTRVEVRNLKVYKVNTVKLSKNTQIPMLNYSIWSWREAQILNPEETGKFCYNYRINRIYQSGLGDVTTAQTAQFARTMLDYNVSVNWLTGDPSWALRDHHQSALDALDRLNRYNNSVNPKSRIYALQYDVEPHLLDEWKTDKDNVILQFMELYDKAFVRANELGLSLYACIPSWFDGQEYNNIYGQGNLFDFINKHSHTTVLMSYSAKNYLAISKDEIKISYENRRCVSIGLETKAVGDHGLTDADTFGNKPIEQMYMAFLEIFMLTQSYAVNSNYELLIHDYESFVKYTNNAGLSIHTKPQSIADLLNSMNNRIKTLEGR